LADKQFRNRKKSVGKRWRIEGTYIKIKGLGFKEFKSEKRTLAGIEIRRMIKKNLLYNPKNSTYKSFISLAS